MMKMDFRMSAIIGLIILIIVIFIWKKRGTETQKNKKRKAKSNPKHTVKKQPRNNSKNNIEEEDDDEDEEPPQREAPQPSGNVSEDAKELYNLVHNDLAGGMQIDAFEEVAGDLAGEQPSEVFVALKQKYTEAIDANRDPLRSVTLKDYVEVLKNN